MIWKSRYKQSYEKWQLIAYPSGTRDFGPLPVKYPDIETHNGLINFMLNFIKWEGYRSTRINNTGRIIDKITPGGAGGYFKDVTRISSTTRNGTADVGSTIKGRACQFDAKVGNDRPSEAQLKEQELERSAGGVYEFIRNPDQFIEWYDGFILSLNNTLK